MTNSSHIDFSVVTIGTFDGVHIGHQKIIKRLLKMGREKQLTPKILTFFPHPRMVLQKESSIKLINTIDEKRNILESFGIKNLIIKEFTPEFSKLTARAFVEKILIQELHVKHVIIGYDHRFGKNRTANIVDLMKFGKEFNFDVDEISVQDINTVAVSSTKIRHALKEGDITKANHYLGYEFLLTGKVIEGKSIGHTINFPTANLSIQESYKLIPKHGVYVVKIVLNRKIHFGMMNIGTNPTVNGRQQSIEIHLFNFSNTIYGETLNVHVLKRLRSEQKFESITMLKEQLIKDQNTALDFLKTYEPISV